MQQYRNNRNNGNIYDLRKDLQHTPPPSQQKGSSGSADGRYGFNGEPLSFAPDRTANGTVRRTRTDNSIEFPSQPRRTEQSGTRRTSGQNRNRTAQRSRTAQPEQRASGTARKPQQRRSQGQKPRKTAAQAAQQRYKNQRLRPAQQQPHDPVQREKRKKRRLTRAALKRRRMLRRLMAFVTLLAVIAAGVYLTMTMLFKIGTIQVQTADGTVVQEVGGYSSSQILQALGVQTEENIFSFDPAAKEAELEKQFPLLESIRVVRDYPNTVVVLHAGGGINMTPWIDSCAAAIHAFYPGEEGGNALAHILSGKVNPSAKLPFTIERRWADSPAAGNYDETRREKKIYYREGIFTGYRGYEKRNIAPLFPFGYGLSYTTYKYDDFDVRITDRSRATVTVSFNVTNTGKMAGGEVTQLYVADVKSKEPRPLKELKAFEKVWLQPGETRRVTLHLSARDFEYYSEKADRWVFEKGAFIIKVGASSQDIRLEKQIKL